MHPIVFLNNQGENMEFIKYEEIDEIAIITVNRPEALNALNEKVLEQLSNTLDDINYDLVRCLILTGAGKKSFVAGADIVSMSNLSKKEGEEFSIKGNSVMRKIESLPIPVIAAVNGYALGGGLELALACDIRICSDNAIFGQPETGLGIIPGFGGTQRLARVINPSKAKEIIFTRKNINANSALEYGLVNYVCSQDELLEKAKKLAIDISKSAPIAVRMSKKAINEGIDLDMDSGIALEAKLFGECFDTLDQKEGMKAFIEKRKVEKFINK